ncbi:hypothetical protein TcCL_Unassigned00161 [Trypanosoma cruzi]|nr:hypothetical protein TcCL_Unassigned00161 [Trypanosoma cruzi]
MDRGRGQKRQEERVGRLGKRTAAHARGTVPGSTSPAIGKLPSWPRRNLKAKATHAQQRWLYMHQPESHRTRSSSSVAAASAPSTAQQCGPTPPRSSCTAARVLLAVAAV